MYEIELIHSIDAAHRVVGHTKPDGSPGKCSRIHGHTYVFTVTLAASVLDYPGFVVDFAAIKDVLNEWDHRLLLWANDPLIVAQEVGRDRTREEVMDNVSGVVRLPFNPTSEHMAADVAWRFAAFPGVEYARVEVSETPKSRARYTARRGDV